MGLTPSPTENDSKRQKILVGMLETVGAVGYDAASVRAVLASTGLYRQAFYDNFADKHACYLEAFDFEVAGIEDSMARAIAKEETWRGRLREGLGALLERFDAEPGRGRALVVEVHAAGGEALAKRAIVMKRAVEFIAEAGAGGRRAAPPMAPQGVVAGIHAMVHARLATGVDGGFRAMLPELMYFAVLPFYGSEVAGAEMEAGRNGL